MGLSLSQPVSPVNYDCPTCQSTGKLPNIAGKFFIINDTECQCNGCKSVYLKSTYFKPAPDYSNQD